MKKKKAAGLLPSEAMNLQSMAKKDLAQEC